MRKVDKLTNRVFGDFRVKPEHENRDNKTYWRCLCKNCKSETGTVGYGFADGARYPKLRHCALLCLSPQRALRCSTCSEFRQGNR